jgi:hypothetical protein
MSDRPTCKTCPYWDNTDGGDLNDCRAGRPQSMIDPTWPNNTDSENYRRWPETWDDDWCGEHPDFSAWITAQRLDRARAGQGVHFGTAQPEIVGRFPDGQEVGSGVQAGPPFEADRRAINASTAVSKRLPLPFTDAIHK